MRASNKTDTNAIDLFMKLRSSLLIEWMMFKLWARNARPYQNLDRRSDGRQAKLRENLISPSTKIHKLCDVGSLYFGQAQKLVNA
jgi:hypothetical protein